MDPRLSRGPSKSKQAMNSPSASIDAATLAYWQSWQGRTELLHDTVTLAPSLGLAATLERAGAAPGDGEALPPLWHWLYFLQPAPQSLLSTDGHPQRGGLLPPVSLARRMWAGSTLRWETDNPLRLGEAIERETTVGAIQHKSGRSGELVFVELSHAVRNARGLALTDRHHIVYRSAAASGNASPPPQRPPLTGQEDWQRSIRPDPVLLLRYSALTFNGHRIHYDRSYAMQEEGYAGLVVHGPLIASLLMDLLQRHLPKAQVLEFEFRAVRPTLDLHPFSVHGKLLEGGKRVALWAQDHEGWLTMQATARLA